MPRAVNHEVTYVPVSGAKIGRNRFDQFGPVTAICAPVRQQVMALVIRQREPF
jgi:hypothetical protein